jgi:hypothetical protein
MVEDHVNAKVQGQVDESRADRPSDEVVPGEEIVHHILLLMEWKNHLRGSSHSSMIVGLLSNVLRVATGHMGFPVNSNTHQPRAQGRPGVPKGGISRTVATLKAMQLRELLLPVNIVTNGVSHILLRIQWHTEAERSTPIGLNLPEKSGP